VISEALAALGGASLAIVTGGAIEWWKSERAEFAKLCDDFCILIAQAADAGAEFWLTLPDNENTPFKRARLAGFQNRMAGYNAILTGRTTDESQDEIDDALSQLFKSLTGGDPDDPDRKASMERALTVHDKASVAIIAVRRAAYERLGFLETVDRFIRWRNRQFVNHHPKKPFGSS
jgi:hypothetical protein